MSHPAPIVVLVRPQLGENIGAAARAMSNFGLSELRLVAPRDGWPNKKAWDMASGSESILDAAQLFPDTPSALQDMQRVYGTTARSRDIQKQVMTVEEAMKEVSTEKTALVFGPERTGLENDDIALCDALITIPTSPEKASLNLGQSVVVMGYEWFKQSSESRVQSSEKEKSTRLRTLNSDHLATKSHWHGLFEQLDEYLEDVKYYRVPDKKPVMWQNLRNQLMRGQWSEQEIRTFRGMLRILYEGRKPRRRT